MTVLAQLDSAGPQGLHSDAITVEDAKMQVWSQRRLNAADSSLCAGCAA